MKIRTLLTLLTIVLFTNLSYAAFPIYTNNETTVAATHSNTIATDTIKKKQVVEEEETDEIDSQLVTPPGKDNRMGALSLILSSVGMASIIAAFAVASAAATSVGVLPLLVLAFGLGLAGLITGVKAARRKQGKGMGIAGMVLGIVDISVVAIISFLAVLVATTFTL